MSATRMLDAVYRAASYYVDAPGGRFALHIDRNSPEVDALAAAHEVHTWAYITAYNPGSVAATRERNEVRQKQLEHTITEADYRFLRGEGKANDGAWAPEPSLLVLGIGDEAAAALARRFGQTAIVYGERGGPAQLLWTD